MFEDFDDYDGYDDYHDYTGFNVPLPDIDLRTTL
jgi:hypothetical protein